MQPDPAKFLEDALVACRELQEFTQDKSLKDLEDDRGLQLIVEREFEILGEALNRFRQADQEAFATITDGHRIIGTRNILAHGYDVVEHVILWDALKQGIPLLMRQLETLQG